MSLIKYLKKIILILIYGIASSLFVFLISLLIKNYFEIKACDSMTIIGLLIIMVGALSYVGGNPTGVGIASIGQMNSQYQNISQLNRGITKYFESTVNYTKFYFNSSELNIILNGVFVTLSSVVLGFLS
jgi:hypothetical protein